MMSVKASIFSTRDAEAVEQAAQTASSLLNQGKTMVIPTDTVYGIATDAFSAEGVAALLAAKGRTRQMPPPVLIHDLSVLPGLADEVSEEAQLLAETFWPGALTLILYAQPSLNWDLGDAQGTVALRVPNDPVALELLRRLGPLAVSSANKTGRPAAQTAQDAMDQLGQQVEVIFDDGPRPLNRSEDEDQSLPSTIVDCTSDRLVVVREGAISVERLREVVPSIMTRRELEAAQGEAAEAARVAEQAMSGPQDLEDEDEEASYLAQAAAPASDSMVAGLLTPAAGGVDQRRTASSQGSDQRQGKKKQGTKPYPIDQARSLVFGGPGQQETELISSKQD